MKKRWLPILILLIAAFLFVPAFADEGVKSETEEVDEILLADDLSTLTYNGTVYQNYKTTSFFAFDPAKLYVRKDTLDNPDSSWRDYSVMEIPGMDDILLLSENPQTLNLALVYVTPKGAEVLDSFQNGEFAHYRIGQEVLADFDASTIRQWDKSETTLSVDVRELDDLRLYEIYGYDAFDTFRHTHGAVYLTSADEYYYVNYDALDNTFFDADGNFSYRSGKVPVIVLESEDIGSIKDAMATAKNRKMSITYEENDDEDDTLDPTTAAVMFVIFWSLLVIAPAGGILLYNLIRAFSSKTKSPQRNKIIAILSGIWIGIALLIMILLFVM